MVSPNPPQRTAASLDPWSPVGGAGGGAGGAQGGSGQDPWGGMGPIISSSTIPDPWGGIGGVGVPPSRGSPLVFAGSSSPPSAGVKQGGDPWGSGGAAAPSGANNGGNNDPWGAPANTEASPAKGNTHDSVVLFHDHDLVLQLTPSTPLSRPVTPAVT